MKTRIGAVLSHLQKLMGVGDDSSLETGSVMWGGSEGEADTSVERQTCHIGRWSGVQLKPRFKSEFYPCVTLGNLLNLSEPVLHRWHDGDKNAYLVRFL